jgi:hypothetical protein
MGEMGMHFHFGVSHRGRIVAHSSITPEQTWLQLKRPFVRKLNV